MCTVPQALCLPLGNLCSQFQAFVIQACQRSTEGTEDPDADALIGFKECGVDAQVSEEFTHIALKRPNSVLLLATVPEGIAWRNAFTEAIADIICKSDGKTDVYDMFLMAYRRMQKLAGKDKKQTPKFESTLNKKLYLPMYSSYYVD